jgi:pilus assembly protein CpaD
MILDFKSIGRGRYRQAIAYGLVGGLMMITAGCSTVSPTEVTGDVPDDYRLKHPIAIEESLETLDIPVGTGTSALTAAAKANINGFGQRFRASGSPVIAVIAPSGSPNQGTAADIAVQIEQVLRDSGVATSAIEYRVYRAGPSEAGAPVRIAFNRILAHTAPCRPWPDQLADNGENRNFHNFGCASQQNLAAIVANPLDLLYPRGMTPADAERRTAVLAKYRAGESFVSPDVQEGGTIAQGVGK